MVFAVAHQRQFDLVLDVLDVHRAAVGQAAGQGADDGLGQPGDDLAHPRGHGALAALDGEECLGQRNSDLVGIECNEGAIATDDLQGG